MDKILIFDIKGSMAHFRKYYTNASSLSYGVPPRTVLAGLIAGILGKPKDSYYDIFNSDNVKIGVSLIKPYRKIMQTVNYYGLESINYSLRYQVPLEILVSSLDELCFRIYFVSPEYAPSLAEKLISKRAIYNPYLGITEFLAELNFIAYEDVKYEPQIIEADNYFEIRSCFKQNYLTDLDFKAKNCRYIVERMPVNFGAGRELKEFDNYIYDENCQAVRGKFKQEAIIYNLSYRGLSENIIFME